jgi:uncharacterized protein YjbI with pentapeptide repeats
VIKYKKCSSECNGCCKTVDTAYNIKSNVVLQTIIDKLFIESSRIIYAEYKTDLSETVLKKINFYSAQLQNVDFSEAQLQMVNFTNAELQNARFWRSELQNAHFWKTKLQNTLFGFPYGEIGFEQGARNIDEAFFENVFWNKKTNFTGTAFENKTIKELTKIMGRPPEPAKKSKIE